MVLTFQIFFSHLFVSPSRTGWVLLELEMFLMTHVKFLILFLRNASVYECDQWSDTALTLRAATLSSFKSLVPLNVPWPGHKNVCLRNKVVHFHFSCSCFLSSCPTCMFVCLNMQFFSCLISQVLWRFSPAGWALATIKYLAPCWLFPCSSKGSLGG